MAYVVEGVTRDKATGDPVGDSQVYLLKYNSGTNAFTQVSAGTSDGGGNFSLIADDDEPSYAVLAFDELGSPSVVVSGITRRDLTPIVSAGEDEDYTAWLAAAA